jgi:hippurate hydrolase
MALRTVCSAFWTLQPKAKAKAKAAGTTVAGLHTAGFTPDRERTIRTGVAALTLSVLELLGSRARVFGASGW